MSPRRFALTEGGNAGRGGLTQAAVAGSGAEPGSRVMSSLVPRSALVFEIFRGVAIPRSTSLPRARARILVSSARALPLGADGDLGCHCRGATVDGARFELEDLAHRGGVGGRQAKRASSLIGRQPIASGRESRCDLPLVWQTDATPGSQSSKPRSPTSARWSRRCSPTMRSFAPRTCNCGRRSRTFAPAWVRIRRTRASPLLTGDYNISRRRAVGLLGVTVRLAT